MKYEDLVETAMQMILFAGDARDDIKHALDAMMNDDEAEAQKYMESAKEALAQAHHCQTNIIQKEAAGERCEYSMLFTHAQDTLMTIYSEYHLAEKVCMMYHVLNGKINAMTQ